MRREKLRKIKRNLVQVCGTTCPYCLRDMQPNEGWLEQTLDHIIPLSKDGAVYKKDNLLVVCRACNNRRGNQSLVKFLKYVDLLRRHPKWSTHYGICRWVPKLKKLQKDIQSHEELCLRGLAYSS